MIKLNNKTIESAFLGSTPISKIYKGSNLIYKKENYGFIVTTPILGKFEYTVNQMGLNVNIEANTPTYVKIKGTTSIICFGNTKTTCINTLITALDVSGLNWENINTLGQMFQQCYALETLNISSLDMTSKNIVPYNLYYTFYMCDALKKIICKQSFKDWCIKYQTTIALPTAMREGGSGVWEIVD